MGCLCCSCFCLLLRNTLGNESTAWSINFDRGEREVTYSYSALFSFWRSKFWRLAVRTRRRRWRRWGVTNRWILGLRSCEDTFRDEHETTYALVYGFAFSFFELLTSRLITYLRTSSSLLRLKNFRILVALLGPNLLGNTESVKPGISPSPCLTITKERTAISGPTIHPRTDFLRRSPVRRVR